MITITCTPEQGQQAIIVLTVNKHCPVVNSRLITCFKETFRNLNGVAIVKLFSSPHLGVCKLRFLKACNYKIVETKQTFAFIQFYTFKDDKVTHTCSLSRSAFHLT